MTDQVPVAAASFDEMGLGVAYVDQDGRYVSANGHFCDLLGRPLAEILRLHVKDVAHPSEPPINRADRDRLDRGEIPWLHMRRCYAHTDGSPLWCQVSIAVRRGADGRAIGYVDVIEDVTDHVEAERERDRLMAAEARARHEAETLAALVEASARADDVSAVIDVALSALPRLLDVAGCGVALPDEEGLLRFARISSSGSGKQVAPLYSFRSGEGLVGRAFRDRTLQRSDDLLVDPRSHLAGFDAMAGLRACLAAPLVARGRSLGVLSVVSDRPAAFTAHDEALLTSVADHLAVALAAEQARQALRDEVLQKRTIIDQIGDGVLVVDAQGTIVLANEGAAAALRVPMDAMVGLTPDRYPWAAASAFGGDSAPTERAIVAAVAGRFSGGVVEARRSDGSLCWLELSVRRLLDDAGNLTGAVIVGRDVTARHLAAEEAARERERAERAETVRWVGKMARGVAHSLNRTLALVAAQAELAADAAARPTPDVDAVVGSLDGIARAAHEGGETVRRLLGFVRARGAEADEAALDVHELLNDVALLTSPDWQDSAQSDGRPIVLDVNAPSSLFALGRAQRLREELARGVFDAVEQLPRGGRIDLSAQLVGTTVELSLTSSAAAVPQRWILPHVVVPTAARRPPAVAAAVPTSLAARRVLVVDDEHGLRDAIASLLRRDGHDVVAVSSAEEALVALAEHPADVVVSDLSMGEGLSGLELASRARRQWPTLRFVLCSGLGTSIDPRQAEDAGVDLVLPKPYRPAELRRAIVQLG